MLKYDPQLPLEDFCRLTIETEDLDPVYCALRRVDWDMEKKLRWTASFFAFYHTGTACQMSNLTGDAFWSNLWERYPTNPRASERRHFRGAAGLSSVVKWREMFGTPEGFAKACMKPKFMDILNGGIPHIGQYFSFKAADFRESVFGGDMDWTDAEKHLVGLPRSGLLHLWPDHKPEESIWFLTDIVKKYAAPPTYDRKCGMQEAETIACMLKSYYLKGKPIGKDIVEKRTDLAGYGEDADYLLQFMPKEPM